jgi:hypothetical protein
MAKCDIKIIYDRKSRTYKGGELVTGYVEVHTTQEVECRDLALTQLWSTHGRGNRDSGDAMQLSLFAGTWTPGSHRYPFEFAAPAAPLTYRGEYLNIDHYLQARADIPWAFDAKASEEFMIAQGGSGGSADADVIPIGSDLGDPSASTNTIGCGVIVGIMLIVISLMFFGPLAIFVIPIALALIAWSLRKTLAELRLGTVRMTVDPAQLSPTQTTTCTVTITPTKAIQIKGITATLHAQEICISGSGTNKSTHHHTITKFETSLCDAEMLPSGETVLSGRIKIPPTQAFSFASSNNQISWEMTVQIGLPYWPDWIETRRLIIGPVFDTSVPIDLDEEDAIQEMPTLETPALQPLHAEPASPVAAPAPVVKDPAAPEMPKLDDLFTPIPVPPSTPQKTPKPVPTSGPALFSTPDSEPTPEVASTPPAGGGSTMAEADATEPPAPTPEPTSQTAAETDAEADATEDSDALVTAVTSIQTADRLGPERKTLAAELIGKRYLFDVHIKRVEWTYGDAGEQYKYGRTIVGTIGDTGEGVGVRFPKDQNDKIDGLKIGTNLSVNGVVIAWSDLHRRADLAVDP